VSIAAMGTTAQADVSNSAVCTFRAHLSFSAGSYRTTGSTVSCSGVLAGLPLADGGTVEMWGHYIESRSANSGWTLAWRDGVFDAQIKEALAVPDPGHVPAVGGFDMSGSPVMEVTGTGDSEYKSFIEQGHATFRTDAGQTPGHLRSGTLTQRVALVDGGAGNPAAEETVTSYEKQESIGPPGTGSAPTQGGTGRTGRHHCTHKQHHRRCHRRH